MQRYDGRGLTDAVPPIAGSVAFAIVAERHLGGRGVALARPRQSRTSCLLAPVEGMQLDRLEHRVGSTLPGIGRRASRNKDEFSPALPPEVVAVDDAEP